MVVSTMLGGSLFTTAWRVLKLRVKETASKYTANILTKQSRTADKGWSSRLVVEHGANKYSPLK
jgi:hypothetical protein